MKFKKPKTEKKKVSWNISENTLSLLAVYSKYSGYSEEEIVDEFLENLTFDDHFIYWMKNQRYSKKNDALLEYYDVNKGQGELRDETTSNDSK